MIRISVSGLDEKVFALQQLKEQLPVEAGYAIQDGVKLLSNATHQYPPVPTKSKYVRTMDYSNQQIESYPIGGNFPLEGYVESPTPYAKYLRGDDNGYAGAWMHVTWEKLTDIKARLTPKIVDLFVQRIVGLLRKISL